MGLKPATEAAILLKYPLWALRAALAPQPGAPAPRGWAGVMMGSGGDPWGLRLRSCEGQAAHHRPNLGHFKGTLGARDTANCIIYSCNCDAISFSFALYGERLVSV
jgi:hypothetical protein